MAIKPLDELKGEQADASRPEADVWLSASAGTGKTHVLSARVMRLLLQPGVRPDSLLCLTFTRAGAAEMAERVNGRLASWAMLGDAALRKELFALGEAHGPQEIAHARTLFARLLDARGGGLRVMTIHAFCQTLLASFPLEGGLAPGFRAIEGREQATLAANTLADLAARGEREGDARLLAALGALSLRLGEAEAKAFLQRAAPALDALEALTDGGAAVVRRALGVPADFDDDALAAACEDTAIDRAGLLDLARMQVEWGTATGRANADRIAHWLLGSPGQRANELKALSYAWATKTTGTLQANKPKHPGYVDLATRLHDWCTDLYQRGERARLATDIAHALYAARGYARAYADAKRSAGVVDFDDLIGRAAALLTTPGMGAWIAYKLDQAVDHILVDEAQDTNRRQWEIVDALTAEFWAGAGARGDTRRTLFTVGDTKQAIFGFQGTDPRHYLSAREAFAERTAAGKGTLAQLSLGRSFRSTPPVLDVVDAVLAELGADALGCDATEAHESARGGAGRVVLLPVVRAEEDGEEGGGDGGGDERDEEAWVPTATRRLASKLALQVKAWLDEPIYLSARGETPARALSAGDVMILVRKRGDLAALLVARLQAVGVPVAGVDRLRLAAPLAVKDCLAAVRFAVQPDDDLTLAALLVSPVGGWTQEQLYDAAHVPREGSLWRHLRSTLDDEALAMPRALLAMADFVSPFVFLETMLSGPTIGARAKLLRRLGNESADALDELLAAALQYEREGVATLQGFLDWFDRGTSEVVRDAQGQGDAVRVMTVHAAKGLQAPLVILADAATDPDAGNARDFSWYIEELGVSLPLFRPRGVERALATSLEASAMSAAASERREHWRLLYVAMTRAEEQLVIAGSLGRRQREVPAQSWHAVIDRAMTPISSAVDVDGWGSALVHAAGSTGQRASAKIVAAPVPFERPDWLDRPAPAEARPPRPLAPSSLGHDDLGEPPANAAMASAAERGRLIHALFERLPGLAVATRLDAAERWLRMSAGMSDRDERDDLAQSVCRVLSDDRFAQLFAPGGLAEVPVAGVVDGVVVSGTVDRLVIGTASVEIVDYKTQRRVPVSREQIPGQHLRQMAAYAAVLEQVFPGKRVGATLLYTSGPALFRLTADDLALHKPSFIATDEKLWRAG